MKLLFSQLIYDYPEQLFAEKGVMAIEHADFEGVERLAQVLGKEYVWKCTRWNNLRMFIPGGEIVSTFDTPDKVRLGKCDLIEEIIIGEDKLIKFSGWIFKKRSKNAFEVVYSWNIGVAEGRACTIVLRGATQQILDEAERSIHDALCVLSQTVKEPRICYGGGSFHLP